MKTQRIIFLFLALLFFVNGCKKETDEPKPGNLPSEAGKITVTIDIPTETGIKYEDCDILSLGVEAEVSSAGQANAAVNDGFPSVAYVFNKDSNLILAGFIDKNNTTISIESTAEVLLYFSMGSTLQPYDVFTKYLPTIGAVPFVNQFKQELRALFIADKDMLQKKTFAEKLGLRTIEIINSGTLRQAQSNDDQPKKRVMEDQEADILVDANDIRSGLQVAERGLSQFNVTNTYRRRTATFLYKESFKNLQGVTTTLINNYNGAVVPLATVKLAATSSIRSFKGVLQDWAAGKGMDFAAVATDNLTVKRISTEQEALYKVRIIGGTLPTLEPLTDAEKVMLSRIRMETVLFDFILPMMLDIVGHKNLLKEFQLGSLAGAPNLEALVNSTQNIIASIHAASDAIDSGDYRKVIEEFLYAFINNRSAAQSNEWLGFLFKNIADFNIAAGTNYFVESQEQIQKKLGRILKIMEVIDIGMKFIDYARIKADIINSKTLEIWDLKAKAIEVNFDQSNFEIGLSASQSLKVFIKANKNDDQVVEYSYETTGKFGNIFDDNGQNGKSFTSSKNEVGYKCTAKQGDLGPGLNQDTIKVTCFLKKGQVKSKIGEAKAVATIGLDLFQSSWTPNINVVVFDTTRFSCNFTDQYKFSSAYFSASFPHRPSARSYLISVIKKDGTFTPALSYDPTDYVVNGVFKFRYDAEPFFVFFTCDIETRVADEILRQQKVLADFDGTGIQVTVQY